MKKLNLLLGMTFSAILAFTSCTQKPIPLVYSVENTSAEFPAIELPALEQLQVNPTLPDPFLFADGKNRVTSFKDWSRRRSEIIQQLQHYELGAKPVVSKDSIEARMDKDTLIVVVHEKGETLTIKAPIKYPEGDGPFPAVIGVGFYTGSLPKQIFEDRNVACIAFNFMQVMSHTQKRGEEPINRLYPEHVDMGAYSAWPWGISRLIDGLEIVGVEASRIDVSHLAVTGCSFAGKMALYAGAFDERIALTISQEPGGGGVAAWRVSETLGEVETLGRTNYAWFLESMKQFELENVNRLPMDHHALTALIAPRALLVLGNPDWKWLADESAYVSCKAARKVWEAFGIKDRMGYSFEDKHMHCMLPEGQYPEVEAFVDKFLLGKQDVNTNIERAEMYQNVDYMKWMPWAKP